MNTALLVAARKGAEEAVADMPEGALKVKAFEVILESLLSGSSLSASSEQKETRAERPGAARPTSSLADRIGRLAEEGFFREPRGLSEVQAKLAEHGWHYPQQNLSTPLIRLVRKRALRRLQGGEGGKKVWKYSLP
jgi:hypothetical protein